MNSPRFKVYDSHGEYQASAKEPHAAALLAEHYAGSVRYGHRAVVWKSGDDISPLSSFDDVSNLIMERVEDLTHPRTRELRERAALDLNAQALGFKDHEQYRATVEFPGFQAWQAKRDAERAGYLDEMARIKAKLEGNGHDLSSLSAEERALCKP